MNLPLTGNDVVDLRLPGNVASAANDRFLRRVLTTDEYSFVNETDDPARVLWLHWAAKEAAYKAQRRDRNDPRFLHRRYAVHITDHHALASNNGEASGHVTRGREQMDVRWTWCADWVHCTVTEGERAPQQAVQRIESLLCDPLAATLDAGATLSGESIAARVTALKLLEAIGIRNVQIERGRRPDGRASAPRVVSADGAPIDVLVSLSHDGRFAAATVLDVRPR